MARRLSETFSRSLAGVALLLLSAAAQAQSADSGRTYYTANSCSSNCHGVPPAPVVAGTLYPMGLGEAWLNSDSAFETRLRQPAVAQMTALANSAANRADVLAYLLAVRDGTRALTTAPAFATTALSRSNDGSFTVTVRNYRGGDAMNPMSWTVTLEDDAAGEFALRQGGASVSSLTGTCAAAAANGTANACEINGSIRFTPSAFSPSSRTANLVVTSSWTSAPTTPATARTSFALNATAVDAFVVTDPLGGTVSFTTAGSASDAEVVRITDNVGEELRACVTSGAAPFDGLANYAVSASGGSVSGQCVTFAAAGGISPATPRLLAIDIVFSPGATTTPLNARLNLQRYVAAVATGLAKTVALEGNNGAVIALDAQRLFTATPIEVDGTPASADRALRILSRGSSALSFGEAPPPFRIAAGTFSGGSCQPVAATPAVTIADYSVVAGGCAALTGLAAYSGTPSSANECTLTLRFDASATGPRCGVLTIHTNAATQTVVLEGSGFEGPRAVVLEGATPQSSGVLLDFTTQRVGGDAPPPRTLVLRNGGTTGDLEAVLPAIDAIAGFTLARSGACSAIAPYDSGAAGPQCLIAVSFAPTELRSYAESFDILTRPAGSSVAYSAFRVNLAGVGSDTAPALRWENSAGAELTALEPFAKEAGVACTTACEQRAVLRNLGPGSVRVDFVNAIGADGSNWSARLDGCTAGEFVAVNAACGVVVTFNPSTAGTKTATLQAATTGNGPPTLVLTGTSIAGALAPQLSLSQAAAFASTRVRSRSAPVEFSIANSGTFAMQVLGWTVSGPFSMLSTTCPAFPFVLGAGSGCTVTMTFDPATTGAATGSFEVRSDASPASATLALSGNGESAAEVSSGGCSIAEGRTLTDPTLWALVVLALIALLYRRRTRRSDETT